MIERLNFFDLYAYLLPGLAWMVLVAVPYVFTSGRAISADWLSAVAGVTAGYLLGHVLYASARRVPWFETRRDGLNESQRLLDPTDGTLTKEVKDRIAKRATNLWGLPLPAGDAQRQQLFDLARAFLLAKKLPSYAEQMQGMQCLARGFAAALFLASASFLGHLLFLFRDALDARLTAWFGVKTPAAQVLFLLCAVGLCALAWYERREFKWFWFLFLVLLSMVTGNALASQTGGVITAWAMLLCTVSALVLPFLFVQTARRFAREFAKQVYLALAATDDR